MKIDSVIEKYTPKSRQRSLLGLFSFAWMTDAAGVMLMTFTLGAISNEWHLSVVQSSTIASSTFIGMLVGALIAGFIADMVGRKAAINVFLAFTVVFTFLDGFAPSPVIFGVLRFFAGMGYGGLMPSVNTYLSENLSIKIRGRYLVILESSWAIGSILIGWYAVTLGETFGWRSVYYVMVLAALLFIPFLTMKESSRYVFLKKGKRGLESNFGRKIEDEIDPIERVSVPINALFRRKYIKRTLMIYVSWFVVGFVYYGLFIWLPRIFGSSGIPEARALWFSFYMILAQLPGYFMAVYLVEKIGRKPSLILFFVGTGISALIFSFVRDVPSLVVVGTLTSFFCMGIWGTIYAYTPELFPTSFRGTANSSSGAVARIASIIAPYFTASFFVSGISRVLIYFAVFAFIAAVVVGVLGVETRQKMIS
jgi:putative MFS transporter